MKGWQQCAAVASAAVAMGWSASTQAAANVSVDVEIAPPAPRYEVVPPARAGYVWAPGYWRWDAPHHHHAWVGGRYMHEHRGEHWVPQQWSQHNGRYHFDDGHWERG